MCIVIMVHLNSTECIIMSCVGGCGVQYACVSVCEGQGSGTLPMPYFRTWVLIIYFFSKSISLTALKGIKERTLTLHIAYKLMISVLKTQVMVIGWLGGYM